MLIAFSGLPGTGKSTLARALAQRLSATYIRIDTIEQALRSCASLAAGVVTEGYAAAYGVAEDNLRAGNIVVADSVNPLPVTRDAWVAVATRTAAPIVEIELVCSDLVEHRRRIETRVADIGDLVLPDWDAVQRRRYEPWTRPRIVVDTARLAPQQAIDLLIAGLPPAARGAPQLGD